MESGAGAAGLDAVHAPANLPSRLFLWHRNFHRGASMGDIAPSFHLRLHIQHLHRAMSLWNHET